MMKRLIDKFVQHLEETVGIVAVPRKWDAAEQLPYFLRDLYTFFEVSIMKTPILLMVARDEKEQTPATIRKHIVQVQEKWGHEVVYLHPLVSSYNRKRLIEHKVPFVVPGNQMYLPLLGIDLREHFRKIRSTSPQISPSTQAVILSAIMFGDEQKCTPSRLANKLGYAAMTLTRAFDELESIGLGEVSMEGRERILRFSEVKKALWEKARGLMRSPVKRRTYIKLRKSESPGVQAGLTALAHYTLLAPASTPTCALSLEEWNVLKQRKDFIELVIPEPEVNCFEVEIWNYPPLLFADDGVVDRFSLFLSLQDNKDERVESSLQEMMEKITW
jgi:DNA-binding MarR family transcriptional regulator